MSVRHPIPSVAYQALPSRLDQDAAWRLLQALAGVASSGTPVLDGPIALDAAGVPRSVARQHGWIAVCPDRDESWEPLLPLDDAARELLDIFAPLCVGPSSAHLVLAHLGQSLDGRLATVTGSSQFVTGPLDLRHTHRLRALFDAVVVGAQTACVDDPQLTTRLVPGRHPTRIVLDPHARLDSGLRVLNDGHAPTLLITQDSQSYREAGLGKHVEVVQVRCDGGHLCLPDILSALRARGLCRIFIEGGGITVSHFLQAGLLHRLHVVIAPMILGSGTPALQLDPIDRISDAITTRCRHFALGPDVLFDCALKR
jgi:diaminohydroxyphosphoribosylaminopyrimidine deaminase / 5-amino-6-(5-phosphoribosylamino)uracil reductase